MYDWRNKTAFTKEECEAAVGSTASLTLTGTIVEARLNDDGDPFVMFRIDERFNFNTTLGLDLDMLELGITEEKRGHGMSKPVLVLHYGRRSTVIDVDLSKVNLALPIAQRSVAQTIAHSLRELSLPRGLIKPGSRNPRRLPR